MNKRVIWTISISLLSFVSYLFVAGDLNVFDWRPESRLLLVFVCVVAAGLTASCPLIED